MRERRLVVLHRFPSMEAAIDAMDVTLDLSKLRRLFRHPEYLFVLPSLVVCLFPSYCYHLYDLGIEASKVSNFEHLLFYNLVVDLRN
jgi:hypothetical protein